MRDKVTAQDRQTW